MKMWLVSVGPLMKEVWFSWPNLPLTLGPVVHVGDVHIDCIFNYFLNQQSLTFLASGMGASMRI